MSSKGCTLDTCPISRAFYGYRPNLGIDIFFAIVYIAVIVHCIALLVIRKGQWVSYSVCIIIAAVLELAGFSARIYGYVDPFLKIAWIIQYSIITFAPIFTSAALYVCIGRVADYLGRGKFNIRPRLYARIFIPADIFALTLQSSGGALTVSNSVNLDEGISTGQAIIIGGLTLQVVSLTIFFILSWGVIWPTNLFRPNKHGKLDKEDKRVRNFVICMLIAIFLIIGRSVYRVAELSEGIYGSLFRNEVLFIVLDAAPMAIATSLMVLFHPVYMIPTAPRANKYIDVGQELRFLPKD